MNQERSTVTEEAFCSPRYLIPPSHVIMAHSRYHARERLKTLSPLNILASERTYQSKITQLTNNELQASLNEAYHILEC